jgi:hypothetical protein
MNYFSLPMRPFIAPHHTKASGSQALQQRQGVTFVNHETSKAFQRQKEAYPYVIAFLELI